MATSNAERDAQRERDQAYEEAATVERLRKDRVTETLHAQQAARDAVTITTEEGKRE